MSHLLRITFYINRRLKYIHNLVYHATLPHFRRVHLHAVVVVVFLVGTISKWQVTLAARLEGVDSVVGLHEGMEYFCPMTESVNGVPFILQR